MTFVFTFFSVPHTVSETFAALSIGKAEGNMISTSAESFASTRKVEVSFSFLYATSTRTSPFNSGPFNRTATIRPGERSCLYPYKGFTTQLTCSGTTSALACPAARTASIPQKKFLFITLISFHCIGHKVTKKRRNGQSGITQKMPHSRHTVRKAPVKTSFIGRFCLSLPAHIQHNSNIT